MLSLFFPYFDLLHRYPSGGTWRQFHGYATFWGSPIYLLVSSSGLVYRFGRRVLKLEKDESMHACMHTV
jgi:hypothetical protein